MPDNTWDAEPVRWGGVTIQLRERIAGAYTARGMLTMLAVAAVYLAAAYAGVRFATSLGHVSPVWPASGVALATLLLLGSSRWPGIFLGALVNTWLSGQPLLACLGISTGATLEAVLGVLVLRRWGFSLALERVRDVVALVVGAAVGCTLVSALVGTLGLTLAGVVPGAVFVKTAAVWWGGDALGMVVAAPVVLLLWQWRPRAWRLEALALGGAALLTCLEVFHGGVLDSRLSVIEPFLLFPLGVWTALRFGTRGTAFTALLIAGLALWGTSAGRGPFASHPPDSGLLMVQFFIAVHTVTCLLLAAASAERHSAVARLELLATAVRDVSEGVVISEMSPTGPRVVFANEAYLALMGKPLKEVVGQSPCENVGELDPETRQRMDLALKEVRAFRGEVALRRGDGARLYSEMQLSPVRDPQGVLTHWVSTHRDMTATHALRSRLLAAERIASVGTLAAGVGHEINNPLTYLAMSLAAAERGLSRGEDAMDVLANVRQAQEGAERIRLLVQDLRTFSRDGSQERRPVDLRAVVTPALRMTRHLLGRRARLEEEHESAPRVMGSEARLGQVLLNLLINAMQAIPEGAGELGRHVVRVRTGTAVDGRALVEVSDTGQGISPEVLPHIFEPFFTTKAGREGTGLGLSICQQIVRAHEGELLVRSEPGLGSVFTVLLPAAPREAASPSPGAPAPGPERGPQRGRILIIDDEPRLAMSMRLLLEPSHDVVTTTRGSEALEWVSAGQRFDLVVCDVQMPGTTGMDIYARLRAQVPELAERLIFISGGACSAAARDFLSTVPNRVLEKPVRPDVLLATVDAALAPTPAKTGS